MSVPNPVRPLFIFGIQWRYFDQTRELSDPADSNGTDMFKAQKGSKDIVTIANVTSVKVQLEFYEATRILLRVWNAMRVIN